jgi:phosphate-selective porin OprO and OprP
MQRGGRSAWPGLHRLTALPAHPILRVLMSVRLPVFLALGLASLPPGGAAASDWFRPGVLAQADIHRSGDLRAGEDAIDGRRFRLRADGTITPQISYSANFDVADGAWRWDDVAITWTTNERFRARVGHIRPALSMEVQTADSVYTFAERPAATSADFGRAVGIAADWQAGNVRLEAGLQGFPNRETEFGGGAGWRGSVRTGWQADRTDGVFYLGAAAAIEHRPEDAGSLSLQIAPEFRNYRRGAAVSAGQVEDSLFGGVEAAWQHGPLTVKAEVTRRDWDSLTTTDVTRTGGWIEASWMLTGETKPFDFRAARFNAVVPRAPGGAFDIAARVTSVELDGSGRETYRSLSLGANWYRDESWRVGLFGMLADYGSSDDAISGVALRLQYQR